ncbi:signal transduction histidine kinase [Kribbella orskensis]|uniref:histidine kinase n=2 Tax=Kribbellaceae TaxID=2726069 RepID=A0ABY2BNI2_9ACTN|nr:signal transduction histidine kinase [Kribbella sp. VKM Ac-2500]TCO25863.1 signal transduction histidine kinase [Kribbella orskensis]
MTTGFKRALPTGIRREAAATRPEVCGVSTLVGGDRAGPRPSLGGMNESGGEEICGPTNHRRWGNVLAVGAVGTLSALTIIGRHANSPAAGWLVLDIVVGVVACGLIPLLGRRPIPIALVLAALAAISPAATPPATVGTLTVAQRRPLRVAALVALAGVVGHLVQGIVRPRNGLDLAWYAILDVAVHAALLGWGQWTQARRALVGSLRDRALRAEAEQGRRVAEARTLERTKMAREMHDVLAHRLSLLATYAGALEYRPDSSPEKLAKAAGVIRTGVHQALDELREVISVLRDTEIDELPGGRPQPTFGDLRELVAESRDAGAEIRYDETVADPSSLPPATGRTAYRVVQEGLTNARKHAAGYPVTLVVQGRPGESLQIELTNPGGNGVPLTPGSGTGLVGLTERVHLAGGTLDHGKAAGGGFRLHASLPWPA